MPTGVYQHKIGRPSTKGMWGQKHLLETKKKMSEAVRGEKNHQWGKHLSDEHKEKISKALKGRRGLPLSEETKRKINTPERSRKISEALKGKKLSEEHKKKLSDIKKKGKFYIPSRKGYINSAESNLKRSKSCKNSCPKGEKHYLWKGGIAPENKKIRRNIEYRLWREAVFARDNWTCQKYGIKGGKLHPHHIQNFADYPELRFSIDNGITLSENVHQEFHKIYGIKNNTKEQIDEFLQ